MTLNVNETAARKKNFEPRYFFAAAFGITRRNLHKIKLFESFTDDPRSF